MIFHANVKDACAICQNSYAQFSLVGLNSVIIFGITDVIVGAEISNLFIATTDRAIVLSLPSFQETWSCLTIGALSGERESSFHRIVLFSLWPRS